VRFRLHPADHYPRHVHGELGETVVVLELKSDGTVMLADRLDSIRPGNAKRSDVKRILSTARENVHALEMLWERMHP
jgi:hypothetical protein